MIKTNSTFFLAVIISLLSCQKESEVQVRNPVMRSSVSIVNGWATQNGGTVGAGQNSETVTVNTEAAFKAAVSGTTPRVVYVDGTVSIGYAVVGSNKSIIGLGLTAKTIGTIRLEGSRNIIIKNLTCTNPTGDGIAAGGGSTNFFISHCTVYNCGDGAIDITKGSDFYTIEWCKFYYDAAGEHNFPNLIGADNNDPDVGKLNGTFHHNLYGKYCVARMPRVRFGKVHVYNNYFDPAVDVKVSCLMQAAIGSQILAENNHFESGDDGFEYAEDGKILGRGTTYGARYIGERNSGNATTVFTPPYSYTLDSTSNAVVTGAGVNGDTSTMIVVTPPPAEPPVVVGDVTSFVLWNAAADVAIRTVNENDIFDISDLGTTKFSMQAIVPNATYKSVKFVLSGPMSHTYTDNLTSWFLFGNDGASIYHSIWSNPLVGEYTLTATPYTGLKATGTLGIPRTIKFSFKL